MMNSKDMDGMMGMMSKMMGSGMGMDMLQNDDVMMEMMPQGLSMMLTRFPKEKRGDLVLKIIPNLVEQASAEMSEEEKKGFIDSLIKTITPEKKKESK